jgi:hypothetical protein
MSVRQTVARSKVRSDCGVPPGSGVLGSAAGPTKVAEVIQCAQSAASWSDAEAKKVQATTREGDRGVRRYERLALLGAGKLA